MTEILTESFCERCGTRYTFESAAPKRPRLRGLKVIGRGLKNFVLSDDSSLDEALAAARSEAEYEVTTHQLDAFHRTFNFCMTCRQYTCENCWDPVEARCLTCAPDGEKARAVAAAEAAAAAAAEAEAARAKAMIGTWPVAEFIHEEEAAQPDGQDGIAAFLATAHEARGEPEAVPGEGPEVVPAELAAAEPMAVAEVAPAEVVPAELAAAEPMAVAEVAPAEVVPAELAAAEPMAVASEEPSDLDLVVAAEAPITFEAGAPAAFEAEAPAAFAPEAPITAEGEAPATAELEAATESLPAADAVPEIPETAPTPPDAAPTTPPAAPTLHPFQRSIKRYRPGQSLDDEIAAYEAGLAAGLARSTEGLRPSGVAPESVIAEAATPAPARPTPPVEPQPEPPAEHVVETAATAASAPEIVAAAASAPEIVAAAAPGPRADVEPPTATPAPIPVATPPPFAPPSARPSATPAWPTGARWPTAPTMRDSSTGTPVVDPLAAALARRATDAMWAQSATELLQAQPIPVAPTAPVAGVQSCQKCGLSLSATARFCRRCGTRQEG